MFVLIDEVESLAGARQAALNGSEPSDSIRVTFCSRVFVTRSQAVNAVLLGLDQLRLATNCLVCVPLRRLVHSQ